METVTRHQWISEAAYYKALARHFAPGKALDDWLAAEEDYVNMKIANYLTLANEDNGTTTNGLQQLAQIVGVVNPEKITDKTELIQAIQQATHQRPCFRADMEKRCHSDTVCHWKTECKKMIAEWCR